MLTFILRIALISKQHKFLLRWTRSIADTIMIIHTCFSMKMMSLQVSSSLHYSWNITDCDVLTWWSLSSPSLSWTSVWPLQWCRFCYRHHYIAEILLTVMYWPGKVCYLHHDHTHLFGHYNDVVSTIVTTTELKYYRLWYTDLVKSVISIMIMHICLAMTMMSLSSPLQSWNITDWYTDLVKSVISIMIMHICLAMTMMSLSSPLQSWNITDWYTDLVKSVISIMIMHICLAMTMMSFPLSSLQQSWNISDCDLLTWWSLSSPSWSCTSVWPLRWCHFHYRHYNRAEILLTVILTW